ASIFVQPSVITGEMRSVGGIVLVWTLAGLLTLAGALICAELASAYPLSGGVYVFLREAYSPGLGFLWGWAMFWSMHSGIIAAIAMVVSRYVAYFVPLGDTGLKAVAIAALLALSVGTLIVTAAYLALNAVYLYVLPLDRVIASNRVAAEAAAALVGQGSGAAIAALVVASSFGALAGIVLTGPRVYFSMARD